MKILVALSRFPYPKEKGDKLRAYHQLKGLATNHDIHLVSLNHEQPPKEHIEHVLGFCKTVEVVVQNRTDHILNLLAALFSFAPIQVHYFKSAQMKRVLKRVGEQEQVDVLYVQLIRLGMNIPTGLKVPRFLDYMDSFSRGMLKRVPFTKWYAKPFVRIEARRLAKYEVSIAKKFDAWSMITEADIRRFPNDIKSKTLIIPNGVGLEFFAYGPNGRPKDYDLIFTGNLGYHPNVQATKYLIKEILPALHRRGINPRICLAGVRPAPEIIAFKNERIEVTGYVEDMCDYLSRAKLYVAPMISGSGLQNKLLESMAMGMPTLTTPLANNALNAKPGVEIIICDSAREFADTIVELLQNPESGSIVGAQGRLYVKQNFNWEHSIQKLEKALADIVEKTIQAQ